MRDKSLLQLAYEARIAEEKDREWERFEIKTLTELCDECERELLICRTQNKLLMKGVSGAIEFLQSLTLEPPLWELRDKLLSKLKETESHLEEWRLNNL